MSQLKAVGETIRLLREHDIFRRDLSESHVLSWPMVRETRGSRDFVFFIYPDPPAASPAMILSRPSHWVQVSGEQGLIRAFACCEVLDFANPSLPKTVERAQLSMTLSEVRQTQQVRLAQFDRLAPLAFTDKVSLPEEVGRDAQDYLAWLGTVHPGFMPYYEQLAPEFLEWLAR